MDKKDGKKIIDNTFKDVKSSKSLRYLVLITIILVGGMIFFLTIGAGTYYLLTSFFHMDSSTADEMGLLVAPISTVIVMFILYRYFKKRLLTP